MHAIIDFISAILEFADNLARIAVRLLFVVALAGGAVWVAGSSHERRPIGFHEFRQLTVSIARWVGGADR